jgi:tellurite resistance protein
MDSIIALGLIGLFFWLFARARRNRRVSQASDAGRQPVQSITTAAGSRAATASGQSHRDRDQLRQLNTSPAESAFATAEGCWVPPGQETTVAGYSIRGGMVYIGKELSSITGLRVEPALIDPSLPVKCSRPERSGAGMTYWPSYSSISPECRAAYLDWLGTGRRDPSAYIGYVFLYLYGLERRALVEAPRSARAKEDLPAIAAEVEQLLHVYGGNNSFRGYATQLLDVLRILAVRDDDDLKPSVERSGYEMPFSVRVGIGRILAAGKPLPPDWALSWFLTHPETGARTRTPMRRCPQEFGDLFRARYASEYGDGLLLKPNRSKLKMAITPASPSFGGQVDLAMDLPDVAVLTAPFSKLCQIGERCATDLDAFSRWVGRNIDAPKTIAAVALLPPELATTHDSGEARVLWEWVEKTVGSRERAVCNTDDLLQHCASFGHGKLAKSEAVLLAQLLEKGGYGIEPDVRFGGAPLAPGGTAVVFKLPPGARAIASPQYSAATVLLHLAVAISAADGSISPSEEQHLEEHMRGALSLGDAERLRLSAHLAWLMKSPPSLTGVKKRLESLDQRQRSAIADFIISVAGADGQISPDEIRTLSKIYPMLGLAADDVYSHVHAMATGARAAVETGEPVMVIPAQPSTGFAIPSRPGPTHAVQLDMTAVKTKLAESAQISAILGDIFTDDDTTNAPAPTVTKASMGKVPSVYGVLLSRLVERPEWSRSEFETIAAECRLLPDGAIDTLNEAGFEHIGGPVLEGDDPIQIDTAAAKELLV